MPLPCFVWQASGEREKHAPNRGGEFAWQAQHCCETRCTCFECFARVFAIVLHKTHNDDSPLIFRAGHIVRAIWRRVSRGTNNANVKNTHQTHGASLRGRRSTSANTTIQKTHVSLEFWRMCCTGYTKTIHPLFLRDGIAVLWFASRARRLMARTRNNG